MTEHLPECWAKHESDPPAWCICDELRACEERVLKDTVPGEWHEKRMAWVRKDALDAAREAVKGVNWFNDEGKMLSAIVATADSIAAIDALRKKP